MMKEMVVPSHVGSTQGNMDTADLHCFHAGYSISLVRSRLRCGAMFHFFLHRVPLRLGIMPLKMIFIRTLFRCSAELSFFLKLAKTGF